MNDPAKNRTDRFSRSALSDKNINEKGRVAKYNHPVIPSKTSRNRGRFFAWESVSYWENGLYTKGRPRGSLATRARTD